MDERIQGRGDGVDGRCLNIQTVHCWTELTELTDALCVGSTLAFEDIVSSHPGNFTAGEQVCGACRVAPAVAGC